MLSFLEVTVTQVEGYLFEVLDEALHHIGGNIFCGVCSLDEQRIFLNVEDDL